MPFAAEATKLVSVTVNTQGHWRWEVSARNPHPAIMKSQTTSDELEGVIGESFAQVSLFKPEAATPERLAATGLDNPSWEIHFGAERRSGSRRQEPYPADRQAD